jgi:hypothetical protein
MRHWRYLGTVEPTWLARRRFWENHASLGFVLVGWAHRVVSSIVPQQSPAR